MNSQLVSIDNFFKNYNENNSAVGHSIEYSESPVKNYHRKHSGIVKKYNPFPYIELSEKMHSEEQRGGLKIDNDAINSIQSIVLEMPLNTDESANIEGSENKIVIKTPNIDYVKKGIIEKPAIPVSKPLIQNVNECENSQHHFLDDISSISSKSKYKEDFSF